MLKAVLLDFYGTLVQEDDELIAVICEKIKQSAAIPEDATAIGAFWWKQLSLKFRNSYGDNFKRQREIEFLSLKETIQQYQSDADPAELSEPLFSYWMRPPIFSETSAFLEQLKLPVCVVSNIDRQDIYAAMDFNDLSFPTVITSEDARSYKPRPEIFQLALSELGLSADEVLHVGDSWTSDVLGAKQSGIAVAWINHNRRLGPSDVQPDYTVECLMELLPLIGSKT